MSVNNWNDIPEVDKYQFKLRDMSKHELITLVNQQNAYIEQLQQQNRELQTALRSTYNAR